MNSAQFEDTILPPASPTRNAWRDISSGLSQHWMWTALAVQDIRLRYRGSILGPIWLTLSTVVMVTTMGVIYSRLLNMQVSAYLPYLALGLIIWQFILSLFTDGCQTFIAAENIIQQIPVPFSVHAYRVVFRNLLMLAHNAVIIPVGMIIFQMPVGWRMLQMVPALIVLLINGVWISVLCGMMSARFRDVPPIIMSVLSILFFVTPIIWPIDALGDWRLAAELNPAFAAIEVVRAPLLGVTLSSYAWPLLISTTFAGCLITFTIFARFRSRIAYWL